MFILATKIADTLERVSRTVTGGDDRSRGIDV